MLYAAWTIENAYYCNYCILFYENNFIFLLILWKPCFVPRWDYIDSVHKFNS